MTPEQEEKIIKNLPLVSINLKQILSNMSKKPAFLSWDDLEQSGREGLMRAILVENTKPDNIKWPTFAKWHIKQAIRDALEGSISMAGERQIRMPHRIHVNVNHLMRAEDILTQSLKREPYPEEVAEYLGWDIELIQNLQEWSDQNPESYDWIDEEGDGTIGQMGKDLRQSVFNPTAEDFYDPIVKENLMEVLNSPMLSEREREILFRTVVGEETFEEIGDGMDPPVTRQRIQQVQVRALEKIKEDSRIRKHKLEDMFDGDFRTDQLKGE